MSNGHGSEPPGSAKPPDPGPAEHHRLRSFLGAWALHACSPAESQGVERHLPQCPGCAAEAARLREAVTWLSPDDPLDLDPLLRARVLEGCLGRRPARIPNPSWAASYTAETARLDSLLGSLGPTEWATTVQLTWFAGSRDLTVANVLSHLCAVDGLVAARLGLADPLGPPAPCDPDTRTEIVLRQHAAKSHQEVRALWREQSQAIVRTAAFADPAASELTVGYGGFTLSVREALLDRAFECWIHADDIARAVAYPYDAPAAKHLGEMISLAARMLPSAMAGRRRQGLAVSAGRLVEAGTPGRSIRLEVEGPGGGDWYVPLDSPAAIPSPGESVAHIALDGVEFCQLTAGHRDPEDMAAGTSGDPAAVLDVLYAAASLSRL